MSEPVLEKSKSTLSKGTSSAPQTWAEYKERLKVFGWQNGTSYKWYYFNLNCWKLRKRIVWIRGDERYFIVFFRVSVSPFCFFYSRENACDLSRKSIRMQQFDLFMRSDREWSRQRDESLIDILTEFCPSLVFYLFYKEREKNVKESANHQKLSFKRQEHEGWIFHRSGRHRSVRGTVLR